MDSIEAFRWMEPVPRSSYPHMLSQDYAVWTAWLRSGRALPARIAYDLKVGTPIATDETADAALRAIAEGSGCKRIDAVCDWQTELWVVEVKPYGNHAALGQAMMYRELFRARYEVAVPIIGVICCSEVDPDLQSLAESLGLRVEVVAVELAEAAAEPMSLDAAAVTDADVAALLPPATTTST